MLDIGLARSHAKYLALGKSPSDDNAFSLPVIERWFRLFCDTNVVWIKLFAKTTKIYTYIVDVQGC